MSATRIHFRYESTQDPSYHAGPAQGPNLWGGGPQIIGVATKLLAESLGWRTSYYKGGNQIIGVAVATPATPVPPALQKIVEFHSVGGEIQ